MVFLEGDRSRIRYRIFCVLAHVAVAAAGWSARARDRRPYDDPAPDMPMPAAPLRPTPRARRAWRVLVLIGALPLVLGAILWSASALSDSGRIPAELAAARQEPGEMICADGRIVPAAEDLIDRLLSGAVFRCTSWRMRLQLVEPATGATHWPSSPRR